MNNKIYFTKQEVIESVRSHPITMIAVDKNGTINDCVSLGYLPDSNEDFMALMKTDKHKGCSVSFIQQDTNFSETDLLKRIQRALEGFRYEETHKMKPGVNIPDEEAMKRYMVTYNKILRSFYLSGCVLDENGKGVECEISFAKDNGSLTYRTKGDGCFSYEFSKIRFWDRLFKQALFVTTKVGPDKYEKKIEYRFRFLAGKRLKLKLYPFSDRVEENIEKVK